MDVYRLVNRFSAPQVGLIENVYHFKNTGSTAASPTDAARDLCLAFNATLTPKILAILSSEMQNEGSACRRVSLPGGPTVSTINVKLGTKIDSIDNTAIAFNIAWVPKAAPWEQGHTYLTGLPMGSLQDNVWSQTVVTEVQSLATELLKPLLPFNSSLGTSWQLCLWTRKTKSSRDIDFADLKLKPVALNKRLAPYP